MYIICTYLHKLHPISWKHMWTAAVLGAQLVAFASIAKSFLPMFERSTFVPLKVPALAYSHTHARTHTHSSKWQVESNVALEVLAQYFSPHEVWNSRQCRTLAQKTRFIMRRSLKKYWKSFPFHGCASKIRFLMVRRRLRKYGNFLLSVTVPANLRTWCRGAQ